MPTVKITAFDAEKLPSPLQLKSWREDWAASGGNWQAPVINKNTATYSVTGRTVLQVEDVVDPTINTYNDTHPGNDSLSVVVA